MKNKIYFMLSIILIITIIIVLAINNKSIEYKKISYEEMLNINNNGIILDVRTIEEYNEGYVENSINLPVDDILNVSDIVPSKDSQIFIYCRSGVRSKEAANELISMGYTNVYDIGGIIDLNIELVKE